jgi:hypothetical protein
MNAGSWVGAGVAAGAQAPKIIAATTTKMNVRVKFLFLIVILINSLTVIYKRKAIPG